MPLPRPHHDQFSAFGYAVVQALANPETSLEDIRAMAIDHRLIESDVHEEELDHPVEQSIRPERLIRFGESAKLAIAAIRVKMTPNAAEWLLKTLRQIKDNMGIEWDSYLEEPERHQNQNARKLWQMGYQALRIVSLERDDWELGMNLKQQYEKIFKR